MFSPVSAQAQAITDLILVLFAICAAIFLLVLCLVAYAAGRFRRRDGDPDPRQVFGNSRVETLWTAGPLLLLIVVFALTVHAMRVSDPETASVGVPDLRVIGHQWWWEVRYPADAVVTANEIHIPTGTRLLVELSSADVIHDFWVPQLGRKMDMVPGHPTRLWIESNAPGTYTGACAEYCGAEHAWMRLRVVAEPAADFARWIANQRRAPAAPVEGAAAQGAQLFVNLTCANCHAVGRGDDRPRIGPDLTHLASRRMLAAERIENNPETLAQWLAEPDVIKPASHMPNAHLSRDQVTALVAYLGALR
jgi:cytochrome c oxidase subunit 2